VAIKRKEDCLVMATRQVLQDVTAELRRITELEHMWAAAS
jgi:hypothetical protein